MWIGKLLYCVRFRFDVHMFVVLYDSFLLFYSLCRIAFLKTCIGMREKYQEGQQNSWQVIYVASLKC
jgi:hypothetical protein